MNFRARHAALDKIDLKILQILQNNGRVTNRELAKLVSLSPSACLARVKKLETDKVIAGYHATLRPEFFRPTMFVFVELTIKQHSEKHLNKIDQALKSIPQVVEAYRVNGLIDYMLKILVADIPEWRIVAKNLLREDFHVEKMSSHIVVVEAKLFNGYPIEYEKEA